MKQQEQIPLPQLPDDEGYFARFSRWARKYFGGNSTAVRNWLLIAGIAFSVILFLLGSVAGGALPAAVLLGLLIGVGVIASLSMAAAMIAMIRAAVLDYAEYQKKPTTSNYLYHLLKKFVDWIKHHPINFMLVVSLVVLAPLAAIPDLIGLSVILILLNLGNLFSITIIADGVCRFFDYLSGKIRDAFFGKVDTHSDNRRIFGVEITGMSSDQSTLVLKDSFANSEFFHTHNKGVIQEIFNKEDTPFKPFLEKLVLHDCAFLSVDKDKEKRFQKLEYLDEKQVTHIESKGNTIALTYSICKGEDKDIQEIEMLKLTFHLPSKTTTITLSKEFEISKLPSEIQAVVSEYQNAQTVHKGVFESNPTITEEDDNKSTSQSYSIPTVVGLDSESDDEAKKNENKPT